MGERLYRGPVFRSRPPHEARRPNRDQIELHAKAWPTIRRPRKPVSVMRIKATGTILENLNDGRKVKVAWDRPFAPRDWYFYTYRTTIVEADLESDMGRRVCAFTFADEPQDYGWFLERPYWAEKYGVKPGIGHSRHATGTSTLIGRRSSKPISVEV